MASIDGSKYLNGTTSQSVKGSAGTLYGISVNSHSSGTIKLWDNTSAASTVLVNTITLAAGPQQVTFPAVGISFNTGLFITVGGTIDYTVIYK